MQGSSECKDPQLNTCSHICTNYNGTFACSCNEGFRLTDEHSGVCKAKEGVTELIYSTGEQIRGLEEGQANRESEIIMDQARIEGIDFDPVKNIIYWVDSQEKSIKRSFIPKMHEGAEIGYPQDIQPAGKGLAKPTDVAFDWVTDNLYWTEVDTAGLVASQGRVVVAKADGRYKRSVVSKDLEMPTSIVVDPEHGLMFWADSGAKPKIEMAWMDGSKRRTIVSQRIERPEGLAIDFSMGHTVYWVDSKLNKIESMNEDGERRNIVARGTHLGRPLSIDVFESMMFWVSSGSGDKGGEVMQMDKFGRGVTQTIASNLQHTASVKMFHQKRYNTTIGNPCEKNPCTHLCLITPGRNYRCKCPNNTAFKHGSKTSCDAALEDRKPPPRVCKCQNGALCKETESGENRCVCKDNFQGEYCDVRKDALVGKKSGSSAAIVVPILLIIMVIVCAISLYVYYQRKRGETKVLGGITNSVSFRQGTNVEFEGPSFVEGGNNGVPVPQKGVDPPPTADNRDFSNPMYGFRSGSQPPTVEAPEAAVLAPSVVTHQSPPQPMRHRELNPASIDTGRDTQCLVAEDDSEC